MITPTEMAARCLCQNIGFIQEVIEARDAEIRHAAITEATSCYARGIIVRSEDIAKTLMAVDKNLCALRDKEAA